MYLVNKLLSGVFQYYCSEFGVGVVEWWVMVLLVVEFVIIVNWVCKVIGLDKVVVSCVIKSLDSVVLIMLEKSDKDVC